MEWLADVPGWAWFMVGTIYAIVCARVFDYWFGGR